MPNFLRLKTRGDEKLIYRYSYENGILVFYFSGSIGGAAEATFEECGNIFLEKNPPFIIADLSMVVEVQEVQYKKLASFLRHLRSGNTLLFTCMGNSQIRAALTKGLPLSPDLVRTSLEIAIKDASAILAANR